MKTIPIERALQVLRLDPERGRFTRLHGRGNRAAGAEAGTAARNGYRLVSIDGTQYLEHRLVWAVFHREQPEGVIDHINGDTSDNRPANLRCVSRCVNQQNRRAPQANATSGRMGVTWHKRAKRWQAAIKVYGETRRIGLFRDLDEAANAYLSAKRALHPGCTI